MMRLISGDVAMNLIGLILIAALSGFIVAVSLGLRSKESSAGTWPEGEGLLEEEAHQHAGTQPSWAGRAA